MAISSIDPCGYSDMLLVIDTYIYLSGFGVSSAVVGKMACGERRVGCAFEQFSVKVERASLQSDVPTAASLSHSTVF